jgi:thiol-disulfide isomerase/thioredoxin
MKKMIFSVAMLAIVTASCANGNKAPQQQNAQETPAPQVEALVQENVEEGFAPTFTLNDINGKPLELISLRGKYVVLDFWGSWCGWCIKGMPEMKNYYEKYQGKFESLGVDCGDTEEKWREAVKNLGLPWLHVYNPRDSKVLESYGIQGFPTKIVVGPDGKIVKTIVGEDPAFYTLLDELFGSK